MSPRDAVRMGECIADGTRRRPEVDAVGAQRDDARSGAPPRPRTSTPPGRRPLGHHRRPARRDPQARARQHQERLDDASARRQLAPQLPRRHRRLGARGDDCATRQQARPEYGANVCASVASQLVTTAAGAALKVPRQPVAEALMAGYASRPLPQPSRGRRASPSSWSAWCSPALRLLPGSPLRRRSRRALGRVRRRRRASDRRAPPTAATGPAPPTPSPHAEPGPAAVRGPATVELDIDRLVRVGAAGPAHRQDLRLDEHGRDQHHRLADQGVDRRRLPAPRRRGRRDAERRSRMTQLRR